MVQITIPQVNLENLLLRRANRFVCGAGEHRMGGNLELLYRSVSSGEPRRSAVREVLAEGLNPVFICTGRRPLGAEAVEECFREAVEENAKTRTVLSVVESEGVVRGLWPGRGWPRYQRDLCAVDCRWRDGVGKRNAILVGTGECAGRDR